MTTLTMMTDPSSTAPPMLDRNITADSMDLRNMTHAFKSLESELESEEEVETEPPIVKRRGGFRRGAPTRGGNDRQPVIRSNTADSSDMRAMQNGLRGGAEPDHDNEDDDDNEGGDDVDDSERPPSPTLLGAAPPLLSVGVVLLDDCEDHSGSSMGDLDADEEFMNNL
jgi:hypothetical protein